MAQAKRYNGHRSWNAWNVSLWIGNDEGYYTLARECSRRNRNATEAAKDFIELIGITHTADGAQFNLRCVREAIKGLEA